MRLASLFNVGITTGAIVAGAMPYIRTKRWILFLYIQSMKQARVRLMKQMKEETTRFKQWKQAKEKEVLQLKAKVRKLFFNLIHF